MTMINRLKEYYDKCGISSLNFHCQYYDSCCQVVKDLSKFATGRAVDVGTEYQKGILPRLLFLSLDSGSAPLDPRKRSFDAPQNQNGGWLPASKRELNQHWYITHQFAWHVFNEINNNFRLNLDVGKVDNKFHFQPIDEIHKIKPFFAHTNSIKCSVNKVNRKQAPDLLYKNCRNFVINELDILDPDILVTQGNYAWEVANRLDSEIISQENISRVNIRKDDFSILRLKTGKMLLWIHHYHPASRRGVGTTFDLNYYKYEIYAKKAAEFIKTIRTDGIKVFSRINEKAESQAGQTTDSNSEVVKNQDFSQRSDMPLIQKSGIEHREGSGTQMVVSVLEKAWRKHEFLSLEDIALEISSSEAGRRLISDGRVQDIGKRVKRVISWLSSEEYIEKKDELIRLL
jgi:hypothetical protein